MILVTTVLESIKVMKAFSLFLDFHGTFFLYYLSVANASSVPSFAIQHPFLLTVLERTGIQDPFLNIVKEIYSKPVATSN